MRKNISLLPTAEKSQELLSERDFTDRYVLVQKIYCSIRFENAGFLGFRSFQARRKLRRIIRYLLSGGGTA